MALIGIFSRQNRLLVSEGLKVEGLKVMLRIAGAIGVGRHILPNRPSDSDFDLQTFRPSDSLKTHSPAAKVMISTWSLGLDEGVGKIAGEDGLLVELDDDGFAGKVE